MDENGANSGPKGLLLHKYGASDDQYGTVCNSAFSYKSADSVCRQMGYDRYLKWAPDDKWAIQESYVISMARLSCSETKTGFMERCTFSYSSANCRHSEDVFVECVSKFDF